MSDRLALRLRGRARQVIDTRSRRSMRVSIVTVVQIMAREMRATGKPLRFTRNASGEYTLHLVQR